MIRPLAAALFCPLVSLAQLLTQDDPRETAVPLLAGKSQYDWAIDGYDYRQARRISADTLMQFQLNLDGTIKPESIRQLTLVYPSDPTPSTLPSHLRKAEFHGQTASQIQKQIPQAVIPIKPPK